MGKADARVAVGVARIAKVSATMRTICGVAMAVIPIALAAFWALVPLEAVRDLPGVTFPVEALPPSSRALAFLAVMVPAGISLYGLAMLRRLFDAYRRGRIFDIGNARALRGFAVCVLGATAAKVLLVTPALSVILTLHNAPGSRALAVSVSGDDLATLFVGAVLMVVAWILGEAHRLAEDHAQIV